jgi:XTP/dITP diphosphohydrolase
MKLIFASKNEGKVREVSHILSDLTAEILSLNNVNNSPEIIENGKTFLENARLKAEIVYQKYKIPVLADDSGLVVEQLNGEPGIFSARYAGDNTTDEKNNSKLLSELVNFPEPHKAKFVCSAVCYDGEDFLSGYGEIKGKIIDKPRGVNGFGYDPLFIAEGYTKTMAELDSEVKNRISHRAIAFNELKELIKYHWRSL